MLRTYFLSSSALSLWHLTRRNDANSMESISSKWTCLIIENFLDKFPPSKLRLRCSWRNHGSFEFRFCFCHRRKLYAKFLNLLLTKRKIWENLQRIFDKKLRKFEIFLPSHNSKKLEIFICVILRSAKAFAYCGFAQVDFCCFLIEIRSQKVRSVKFAFERSRLQFKDGCAQISNAKKIIRPPVSLNFFLSVTCLNVRS